MSPMLASSSKNSISKLMLTLDTSSDRIAEGVIRDLLKQKERALPLLLQAAQNKSAPRLRKWSLQALGAIGDPKAENLLIAALADSRMTVRLHAVRGLQRMKSTKALRAVSRLIADPSGGVRSNALEFLADVGGRTMAPVVQKALLDPKWYIRQRGCVLLGKWGVPRGGTLLRKIATTDPSKAVRVAAETALQKRVAQSRRSKI